MISYSELSEVLMEEKRSPQLQTLNPLFFEDVQTLLNEYEKKLKEGFDIDLERAFKNFQRKFEELQIVRLKKIFLQALSDFQLNKTSFEGMSDKEKELYASLIKFIKEFLGKNSTRLSVKLKILTQVPKFVGITGKEYGPFEKNSVVELDSPDAELLLGKNIAELA